MWCGRGIFMLSWKLPVFISCFSPGETHSLSCFKHFKSQQLQLTHTVSVISVALPISSSFSLKLFPAIKVWQCHAGINASYIIMLKCFSFSFIQIVCLCTCVFWASSYFRKYWDIIVRQFDLSAADILSQCLMKVYTDLHFLKEIAVLARN